MLGKRKSRAGKGEAPSHAKKQARTQTDSSLSMGKVQKREPRAGSPPPTSSLGTHVAPEVLPGSLTLKQVRVALKTLTLQLETMEGEYRLLERLWYKNAAQFKSALWWKAFDGARRPLKRIFATERAPEPQVKENEGREIGAREVARVCVEAYAATWAPPPAAAGLGGTTTHSQTNGWPSVPKFAPAHPTTSIDTAQHALSQLADLQRTLAHIRTRCLRAGEILALHLNTPPAPTFAPLVTALLALLASIHAASSTLLDPHHSEAQTSPPKTSPISQLTLAFTTGTAPTRRYPAL